jgi:uncharacterized protein YndB with AHSA1/START domain
MKIVLIVVAVIAGLIALTAIVAIGVGSRLPIHHEVSRSLILHAQPADVYRVITDIAQAPQWRPNLRRVEMLRDVNGRRRYREHAKDGAVTYEIVAAEPPRTLITQIVDQNLGYSGSWTYSIAPHETGTLLTITEKGEVTNVFFRFMSRYVFGHATTIETYLKALGQRMRG